MSGVLKAPNDLLMPSSSLLHWNHGVVASRKKDGNRMMVIEGMLYSSSMKSPRNHALYGMTSPIRRASRERNLVFDMEIWSPKVGHHAELSGWINSYEQPPPLEIEFYIFDAAPYDSWAEQCRSLPYRQRIHIYHDAVERMKNADAIRAAVQVPLDDPCDITEHYSQALEQGDEGLMIRHLDIWKEGSRWRGGWWKHGRATMKEGIMFKMKNYQSVDGVITDVIQRRILRSDWPRKYDTHGHLVRPLEQDAYEVTDMVGAFVVETGGFITEVGFGRGFDLDWRRKAWADYCQDPSQFVGRHIEIEHHPHGAMKDGRLRGGRLIRFREDLDVCATNKL